MSQERNTNPGFKPTAYVIIGAIIIAIILFVYFFYGAGGFIKALMVAIEIIMFLGIVMLFIFLAYHLFFKKNKYDVNYVNKKKLIEAGTRLKRPFLKNLYVSGDRGHSRALVGKITGYVRIQTLMRNYLYKEVINRHTGQIEKVEITEKNERGEDIPVYTLKGQEEDVFIVKTKGLKGFFEDEMVIRVNPELHNQLVGDVDLFCYSLLPRSEYWFANSDDLDVRKIDYAILREAERTMSFVVLSDIKEHVDRATGIDSAHKKGLERKSLVEIPETQSIGQKSQYE